MEDEYLPIIIAAAKKNGWTLNQNQFDALADLAWNCGTGSIDYEAAKLVAAGDLDDPDVIRKLEKEILETATYTPTNKSKTWSKNLTERRFDIIRIAKGGSDAYSRNEVSAKWWNTEAYSYFESIGIAKEKLQLYQLEKARE